MDGELTREDFRLVLDGSKESKDDATERFLNRIMGKNVQEISIRDFIRAAYSIWGFHNEDPT